MNTRTNISKSKLDPILWTFVVVIAIAGIAADYYFTQISFPIRLAGWVIILVILGLIASQTVSGIKFRGFIKDSRIELRKVVWPNRQETLQTTLIVLVMVVITALVIWGVDAVLLWAIGWLTGQGG